MRVSSNAPTMSRRSIMRGMAAALVGASVPVAAIAGITARKLMAGDDAELLNQCREWHDHRRRLKRLEKAGERAYREAMTIMPSKPRELFEPIRTGGSAGRIVDPKNNDPFGPQDGSWDRKRLEHYAKERAFDSAIVPFIGPSPECQAHCRKLLALLDEHEATQERLLTTYRRLDRIWAKENAKNWRLFKRIIRTRATTLRGVAAQLKIIDLDGALTEYQSDAVGKHVRSIARNVGCLVAAQAAEA